MCTNRHVIAAAFLTVLTLGCEERSTKAETKSDAQKTPAAAATPAPATSGLTASGPASSPAAKPVAAAEPADNEPTLSGTVTDSAGKPVAGAKINASATLFALSNAEIRSGKDGRYSIPLPGRSVPSPFHVSARLTREYHDRKYQFDLDPSDDSPVAGRGSATRDFVWKLSGSRPDDRGTYGGTVFAYTAYGSDLKPLDLEITLTPDGPLVDGSEGKVIRGKQKRTGDGSCLPDVPIGRYKVTVANHPAGAEAKPLKVRPKVEGEYADSLVADFEPSPYNLPIYKLEVDVK